MQYDGEYIDSFKICDTIAKEHRCFVSDRVSFFIVGGAE
jgi:hypothetical protein